jgi:hypothetical protein
MLVDEFFSDFVEMDSRLMTADPFRFPGFRGSIEGSDRKKAFLHAAPYRHCRD